MNELEEFLSLNNIEKDDLFEALHMDIREIILKIVFEKLKKDKSFFNWTKKVFFSTSDDVVATKKVVDRACKCELSEKDTIWMQTCLKAYFAKKSTRKAASPEEKNELLQKQNGKCAICGCKITLQSMHVDHIIPWDYVGDNLKDNSQGLCSVCNLEKSNHVAITVTNLIAHRKEK